MQNNVRFYRQQLGMSLRELAIRADISTATVVAVERYGDYPGETVREKISSALGVSERAIWPEMAKVEAPNG